MLSKLHCPGTIASSLLRKRGERVLGREGKRPYWIVRVLSSLSIFVAVINVDRKQKSQWSTGNSFNKLAIERNEALLRDIRYNKNRLWILPYPTPVSPFINPRINISRYGISDVERIRDSLGPSHPRNFGELDEIEQDLYYLFYISHSHGL